MLHFPFYLLYVFILCFPKPQNKILNVILLCSLKNSTNSHFVILLTSVSLKMWQRMCFSLANRTQQRNSICYCSINWDIVSQNKPGVLWKQIGSEILIQLMTDWNLSQPSALAYYEAVETSFSSNLEGKYRKQIFLNEKLLVAGLWAEQAWLLTWGFFVWNFPAAPVRNHTMKVFCCTLSSVSRRFPCSPCCRKDLHTSMQSHAQSQSNSSAQA